MGAHEAHGPACRHRLLHPPEWYNHFRMFPPINHNFQQERTLNPHNESEPTQDSTDQLSAARLALRDELARKSRLLASEGMRYYNIFWVRKPLDRMERSYYDLKRRGCAHDVAIKKVLQTFYEELTVKKRVSAIQAEEAKLSGRFITMREAVVVMNVLTQLQRESWTPQQISMLAKETHERARESGFLTAEVLAGPSAASRESDDDGDESAAAVEESGNDGSSQQTPQRNDAHHLTGATSITTTQGADDASNNVSAAAAVAGAATSSMKATADADALADMLADSAEDGATVTKSGYRVRIKEAKHDSVRQLAERAMDYSGSANWYTGSSPVIDK